MTDLEYHHKDDSSNDSTESKELLEQPQVEVETSDEKQDAGRAKWGHKAEFMLACIGYAVGLGNVWRFPWLVQKNGGGAFLIPYAIMLFIEGLPIFYLELSIGQRIRQGPIRLWKQVSPWAIGVGYAMCVASLLSGIFYIVVISWCVYYFFLSMQHPLPWSKCPEPVKINNITSDFSEQLKCQEIGSTQYFWYYKALEIGDSIDDHSGINWKICLCLLLAWTVTSLCMIRGIQTTGKVVYFTATFPYLVLLIFVIRGLILPGCGDGLKHLFVPDWSKLSDPIVWMEAAAQIFFSLSLAFGGLIAYASYNDVHNNTLKDSLIISFTNCGTSIFAGIAIFSILGYRANIKSEFCYKEMSEKANSTYLNALAMGNPLKLTYEGLYKNMTADCTVKHFLSKGTGGSGLAFVAFTEAINLLPGSIFFSLMFFLMLITLGLGSMFGILEGLVTSLRDMPFFQRFRQELIILIVAIPGFLIGVAFTQYSGEYVVQLFNKFSVDIPILVVGLCELVFIAWVYGMERFSDDIFYMTGRVPPLIFRIMWKFISPIAIAIMLLVSLYNMIVKEPQYEIWNKKTAKAYTSNYPSWALGIGVFVFVMSFLFVPAGALYYLYQRRKRNSQKSDEVPL